ncbi:Smr/MutS family protein [Chenggangzhangella methanolivorans]|uniref:Smr/MutS family protein n=1 Tax=Chenggangzhangella methanolivorans TaxID=1437009 RepID=A0A9E6ULJ3_9HYPH|nr:Smr/MutS family protein [Chenggangzhangella methanolivorans]QZN98278.1 Smr/MutS family protein [Chenggangzhangella methanolivorans]
MTRRRRTPSEAELALWAKVAETVAPLPGRRLALPAAPAVSASSEPAPAPAAETSPAALSAKTAPAPTLTPLAPLEARFRRRLVRGVVEIDARIDLHGLRQEEAQRRLVTFLQGAQARGHKLVLVITGKGAPGADAYAERGVLRRAVPMWLSSPAARGVVVGFETAGPTHGGTGALYVRIRKSGRL